MREFGVGTIILLNVILAVLISESTGRTHELQNVPPSLLGSSVVLQDDIRAITAQVATARTQASDTSTQIATLATGSKVKALSESAGWMQIRVEGWIPASSVGKAEAAAQEEGANDPTVYITRTWAKYQCAGRRYVSQSSIRW